MPVDEEIDSSEQTLGVNVRSLRLLVLCKGGRDRVPNKLQRSLGPLGPDARYHLSRQPNRRRKPRVNRSTGAQENSYRAGRLHDRAETTSAFG